MLFRSKAMLTDTNRRWSFIKLIHEIERKEKRKRLPIIAVTARAMFGDKERILENQLDDYIAKPYNLNDVVDTLNKYIDE